MLSLKCLSSFCNALEMRLNNCEINLILTWSGNCILLSGSAPNQVTTFAIPDTKVYVPVVNLSAQDNVQLLQQLKSDFKRTINWSRYWSKLIIQRQNQYLDYLFDLSFWRVYRFFVLSFENNTHRISYQRIYFQI